MKSTHIRAVSRFRRNTPLNADWVINALIKPAHQSSERQKILRGLAGTEKEMYNTGQYLVFSRFADRLIQFQ